MPVLVCILLHSATYLLVMSRHWGNNTDINIRQILDELGHKQASTSLKTDHPTTGAGFIKNFLQQKRT